MAAGGGLTQELEDLFSCVARDLGWSNPKDVLKSLELEISDGETTEGHQKKTHRKTKERRNKAKTLNGKKDNARRKKKSGNGKTHSDKRTRLPDRSEEVITLDSDDSNCATDGQSIDIITEKGSSELGSHNTAPVCSCDTNPGLDKISGIPVESSTITQDQEAVAQDNEHSSELQNENPCSDNVGSRTDILLTTEIPHAESDSTSSSDDQEDLKHSSPLQSSKIISRESSCSSPVASELEQEDEDTGNDGNFVPEDREEEFSADGDTDGGSRGMQPDPGTSSDVNAIACDENVPSPKPSSEDDDREDEERERDDEEHKKSTKRTSPCLSLTERLIRNRRRMKEKSSHNGSSRQKERNASGSGSEEENNDDWSSVKRGDSNSTINQSSFHSYRDNATPARRYASDTSSDDDNFEAFISSIKSTKSSDSQKTPPSQEEMDDFIDDEPIEISSGSEEEEEEGERKEEADEIFYYQCDNAERFTDEEQSSNKENHLDSTAQKSILSESANSTEDSFATPAWHPTRNPGNDNASRKIFKKPSPKTKPIPSVISVLSSSDSDSGDHGFATPSWRPTTTAKKTKKLLPHSVSNKNLPSSVSRPSWNVKATKPLTKPSFLNDSTDSEGDDSVFATPIVRPPLKTKKPSNTQPTRPARPTTNGTYLKPLQGPGRVGATPSFLSSLATPVKGAVAMSPYVTDFKKKKEELTTRLFKLFNKTVFEEKLPSDMSVTWNKRLRKTAGYCYYSKSKKGERRHTRIELSEKVCDSAERLRDTLVHELCHAAAWLINGVHDGHGRYWKYWAAKANISHPEIPVIKRCHSYEINTKFKYQCTRCQTTIGRHSKSIDTNKMCCAYCRGQIVLLPPVNKDGTPAKTRTPNKFAMFVKENYGTAKKTNVGMKHANIMRLLSQDFAQKAKIAE